MSLVRSVVRKYMKEELAPLQAAFEEAGQPSKEVWRALGQQGLLGVSTPAELGGIGGSFLDEMILCEEMCYAFVQVTSDNVAPGRG